MIENKNILQQFKEFMDKHKEFKYTESYIVRNNFKKPMYICILSIKNKSYKAIANTKRESKILCIVSFNVANKNILNLKKDSYTKSDLSFSRIVSMLKSVGAVFKCEQTSDDKWYSSVNINNCVYGSYGENKRATFVQAVICCTKSYIGLDIPLLLEKKLRYGTYESALNDYCNNNMCSTPKFNQSIEDDVHVYSCEVYRLQCIHGRLTAKLVEVRACELHGNAGRETIAKKMLEKLLYKSRL